MKTVILAALTSITSAQSIIFRPDIETEIDSQIEQIPDVIDETSFKSELSPPTTYTQETCETRK